MQLKTEILLILKNRELRRQNQEFETIDEKLERVLDRIRSSMKEKYNQGLKGFKKGEKKVVHIDRGFQVQTFLFNDNAYYQVIHSSDIFFNNRLLKINN